MNSGKPILGIRTATHAFDIKRNPEQRLCQVQTGEAKSGRAALASRSWAIRGSITTATTARKAPAGVINDSQKNHPVLKGVEDIWGPTDVYDCSHLPQDATVLVRGQVWKA